MGALFGSGPKPPPIPTPPPIAAPSTMANPAVGATAQNSKARAAAAASASGQNPTGPQGLKTGVKTQGVTLLGGD